LTNIDRQSLTGVAYSIHHLTCKQDSRNQGNEPVETLLYNFPGLCRPRLYSIEDS